MSHLLENDDFVDQLAEEDALLDEDRRVEFQALETAIGCLSDPLLRQILLKMVDIFQ